jgi:hypothetical protein
MADTLYKRPGGYDSREKSKVLGFVESLEKEIVE